MNTICPYFDVDLPPEMSMNVRKFFAINEVHSFQIENVSVW